jgi:uncharacterized protein (UPF0264 family)
MVLSRSVMAGLVVFMRALNLGRREGKENIPRDPAGVETPTMASQARSHRYNWWMRLLVSVRDALEARAAIAGGADIIDAKEPANGPLAPVLPSALQSIAEAVPLDVPLSVALGDAGPASLEELVTSVVPLEPRAELYFKASVTCEQPDEASAGIAAACAKLRRRPDHPAFIVARYVDQPADAELLPQWIGICADAGARGLLLDTSRKDGLGLFGSIRPEVLADLRRRATRRGLWLAIAGGITAADRYAVSRAGPHVLGVRGAVCIGGRSGMLSSERVEALRRTLGITSRRVPRALPV